MAGKDKVVAEVEIKPIVDEKTLKQSLAQALSNLPPHNIKLGVKLDTKSYTDAVNNLPLKNITLGVKLDHKSFNEAINNLPKKIITLGLKVDKTSYNEAIASLAKKTVTLGLKVDKNSFTEAINNLPKKSVVLGLKIDKAGLKEQLANVKNNISVGVKVSVASFREAIKNLPQVRALVGVRLDTAQFRSEVNRLSQIRTSTRNMPTLAVQADQSQLFQVERRLAIITNQIRRINRMTLRVNTRYNNRSGGGGSGGGGSRGQNGNDRWFGSLATYWTHFIGRSSKGWGSFGEAIADAAAKLQGMSGILGTLGTALAGGAAIFATVFAAGALVIKGFETLVGVTTTFGNILQQIGTTIYNVLKPGIELYKQQTAAIFSFTAALQSNAKYFEGGDYKNKVGEALSRDQARGLSEDLIKRATLEAEMSAFNLEELLRSLQGTLPILLSKGMSLDEAFQINRGVAGVAKMTQLTPSQILQETRDLAQGSITSRGSQVAGALGITNADINKYKGDVEGLFNFLMEKFKNYNELLQQYEDTALGRYQQLEERWQTVTKTIVEGISSQFKGVFEYLINFTGQWVDKEGNVLNALTGKWEDKQGNSFNAIKKRWEDAQGNEIVKDVGDVGKDFSFQLNEELAKVIPVLKDIIDYIAQCVDGFRDFVKEEFKGEEPLNIVRDAIKFCIDMFFNLLEVTIKVIHEVVRLGKAIEPLVVGFYNLGYPVAKGIQAVLIGLHYMYLWLAKICKPLGEVLKGYGQLTFNPVMIAAGKALSSIDGDSLDESISEVAKKASETWNESWTPEAKTYEDIIGARKSTGDITEEIRIKELQEAAKRDMDEYLRKHPEADKTKRLGANEARGVPTSQEDEKARKKALQEAKKAMKDNIKALKEALKDHIADLKDALEKNKIAYDEGFMSLREYLTQKAAIEREEAEATLEEAQAEKAEILATPYEKEEDRLRDLREVNRTIKNAQKSLDKSIVAQNGVAKVIKQYATSFENVGKSHDIMYRTQLGQPVDLSNISGMSNTEVAYRFLTSQGFNDAISQGIIASLKGESLSNPKDVHVDSNGKLSGGIASWNGERFEALKNFAIANNSDWQDIRTQLAFLVSEIQKGGSEAENFAKALQYFNENGKTAEAMVEAWTRFIERPSDVVGQANARKRFLPEVSKELQASSNRQIQVSQGSPTSIYDAIQTALTRDNYLGQTLEHGTVACVEAATKLGAYFSTTLAEAVEQGIVNTDILDLFLNKKDVGWVDFSKANLEPGDLIFFDGKQKNQHVMIYQGNNTVAGNFSSRNNRQGAVGQQNLDEYLQYSGLTPTHIRKTSRTSVFGNLGSPIQDMASQSKEEAEARKLYQEALEKLRQSDVDVEGLQLGKYVVQIAKLEAEKLDKLKSSEVNKYEGADRDRYIQNIEFSYRQKSADLLIKVFTEQAEYNLEKIESDWADIGTKMSLGMIPVDKYSYWIEKYADYFYGINGGGADDGIWGVFNLINKITEQAQVYLKDGNLKAYKSAMGEVKKLRQKYDDMIKSSLDDVKKPFDTALDLFTTSDKYTPLQRDYGERQIKSWQAQAEVVYWDGYIKTLEKTQQGLIANKASASELLEIDKKLWDASMAREKAQLIAEQYPNYLRDLRIEAKKALEDGLVTFLTDGINEAENLGEALRNLAISFLKTIQKFSAERMVKSMMDKWFGGYEIDNPQSLHINNSDFGRTSAEVQADIRRMGAQGVAQALRDAANIIKGEAISSYGGLSVVNNAVSYSGAPMPTLTSPAFGYAKQTYELPALANSQFGSNSQQSISFNGANITQGSLQQFNEKLQETSNTGLSTFSTSLSDTAQNVSNLSQNITDVNTTPADTQQLGQAMQQASTTVTVAATEIQTTATTMTTGLQTAFMQLEIQAKAAAQALSNIAFRLGGYAEGGYISGPGTSTSDSIPAMLSNGEFVVRKSMVDRYGRNFMESVNNGTFAMIRPKVRHYASGGLVSELAQEQTARGLSNFGKDVGTNISNTANISVALVRDEQEGMKQLLRSPEGQRIMLDFSRRYASVTSRF